METGIRRGFSVAEDAREAVQELAEAIHQPDLSLVLFFCSSHYDLPRLGAEMKLAFPGTELVGCTTAGEIGPDGLLEHALVGVSFSRRVCRAVSGYVEHLELFVAGDGHALADRLHFVLGEHAPETHVRNCFGLLLVDGLSLREEIVARTVKEALGTVPLFGGSAGDGARFEHTHIFAGGKFRSSCAVLVLVTTNRPFAVFKTEHLEPTAERWVVTQADPAKRIVREINGRPAAEEFARLAGVAVDELTPAHFAAMPLAISIGPSHYIRAVQKVNPDHSVTFFCAIEEGLVLRVARGVHLAENLIETFARLEAEIGPLDLVLACDCLLRRMEIADKHLERQVSEILAAHNVLGFHTYGEVYDGVHINQTLTGIAFGKAQLEAGGG